VAVTGFKNQLTSFSLCFKTDNTLTHCAFTADDIATAFCCCILVVVSVSVTVSVISTFFVDAVVADGGVFSVGGGVPLLSPVVVPSCWSEVEPDDLVLLDRFNCIFLGCDDVFSVGGGVPLLSPAVVPSC